MSFDPFSSDIAYSPSLACTPNASTHPYPQLDLEDPDEPLSPVPSAADDHHGEASGTGDGKASTNKSGRKKSNPSSQAARRDQNRIAQREFRLRKQQRIRDLEARVEILSEGQDEAYAQLRAVIRDLMDENTTLRGLLRDVAGFIGEGLGGTLKPRTGWDPVKFREFCERGETDTAYEGWLARKRVRGGQGLGAPGSEQADDDEHHDDPSGSRKRRRSARRDSELVRPFGPSPVGGDVTSSDGKVTSDPSLPRSHMDSLEIDWSNSGLAIPQSNPNARSRRDLERPPSTTSSGATNPGPFPDNFSSSFPGGGAYPSGTPLSGQAAATARHSPGGGTGINPSPGGSLSSFPAISPQMSSTRTRVRPSVDAAHGADILPPLPSISTLGPPPLDVGPGLSVGIGVGVGVNIGGPGQQPSSLFQSTAPGTYGVAPQLAAYGPAGNVGAGRPMPAGAPQPSMYYMLHPGGTSAAPGTETQTMNPPAPVADDFGEADPQLREAGALIKYHIDNYRRSENYHLPLSLRPTLTQRTVQHNGVIDGLIFPSMRDRAILLSGRFDLAECFADLMRAVIIHGDDVLAHTNWEISLSWMKRYHFLVDEAILSESINPWRRKRGERELTMQDIQPATSEYSEPNK